MSQTSETIIHDGTLPIVIRKRDGSEQRIHADLWVLKLAMEACEDACGLRPDADGKIRGTPEFFIELSQRLPKYGIPECTPAIAAQLWHAAHEAFVELKKTTSNTPTSPSGSESTPSD